MNIVLRLIKAGLIRTGKPLLVLGKLVIRSVIRLRNFRIKTKIGFIKQAGLKRGRIGQKRKRKIVFTVLVPTIKQPDFSNLRKLFNLKKTEIFFSSLEKTIKKSISRIKKLKWWKLPKNIIPRSLFVFNKFLWLTIIIMLLTGGVYWFYFEFVRELPRVSLIENPPELSTKIFDRKGRLLYKFYEKENRTWVELDNIPQNLIWATLAVEDKNFYKHHGISVIDVIKAFLYNFRNAASDKLRGGSTITQQLVKQVFLTSERTWKRKIKEAILSLLVERKLSKDEILERYFNQVPYGGETYGAQEAAWKYFGKNVWEIDMAEAAFLAGLPAAPSSYSPFGVHPELAKIRQEQVIDQMVIAGYVNKDKAGELKRESIKLIEDKRKINAPHFVFYVKEYLRDKMGLENIERQGLLVTTSLDLDIQRQAEDIVKEEVEKVGRMHITNGGMVVLDPKEGGVLAMVGSKDYYANDIDGKYNVTTALRQPGSSIKPINYLLALSRGKTLLSPIDDSPVRYEIKGQKPYVPQNYNGRYMGRVTLKTALASSLNIPSVKLLDENGVDSMINLGEEMGISTWKDRERFGLSLALGSGEVKMTELSGAYSVFANLGKKVSQSPILEIRNYMGEKIFENEPSTDEIVDPGLAFLINQALSDNAARTPIFGANSKLVIPNKTVAVKTGTTNSLRDNWCIGWTPSFLVAAWVGNNDNSPMSYVASGVSGATPIWNRMMNELLKDKQNESWNVPDNVVKVAQCGKEEYFLRGTEENRVCRTSITPVPIN